MQAVGHALRIEPVTLDPIHPEAHQLTVSIDKAEAVAIGKARHTGHIERMVTQFLDRAYKLAHGLGGIEGGNVSLSTVGEISCIAAVESLLQVGFKSIGAAPQGGSAIAVRMAADNLVEALAVGGRYILDVGHILQASLNLKRRGTGISQSFKVVNLAQVFQ